MKKPSHRIFDYTPRFYRPEDDKDEKLKRKLGFKRQLQLARKKRSSIIWLMFIAVAIFIYLKLSNGF